MKYSFLNKGNIYRYYQFKLYARNILNTAYSDYVNIRFRCPSDNSGITVTPPFIGYAYSAFQQTSGIATAEAAFTPWSITEIYTDCSFLWYGVTSVAGAHASDTGLITYPNPDRGYIWNDNCRYIANINTCNHI